MAKTSTSFKRGQSGNPHGRPKKDQALSELFNEFLNQRVTNERTGERITRKELFVRKMYEAAIKGNVSAMRLIMLYVDGPPPKAPLDEEYDSNDEILLTLQQIADSNTASVKARLNKKLGPNPSA